MADLSVLTDEALLDELQRAAFGYFLQAVNPSNGLVADNSRENAPVSIAVVGFALSSYPIAVEHGWMTRADAVDRSLTVLRFFRDSDQSGSPEATGYKGFYYHFLGHAAQDLFHQWQIAKQAGAPVAGHLEPKVAHSMQQVFTKKDGAEQGDTLSMTSTTSIFRTALGILCLGAVSLHGADFPDPAVDNKGLLGDLLKRDQTAVLAGGCFWCVEAVFRQVEGVDKVVSGYSGGDAASAHYSLVITGKTSHVEAVQITYNPRKISYGQLLKVFFDVAHDPTQVDRQGPDVGPQYRSVIFYLDPTQKRISEAYIKQLEQAKVFHSPIVTKVVDLKAFYPAEEHHQNYCSRNPKDRYVLDVAMPKVEKTKKQLPELLKK